MLRLLGAVLVIAFSTGYGFTMGVEVKQRLEELRALKKLVLMLRGEIKYAKAPLPEAFQNMGGRLKEPFQSWCNRMSEELFSLSGKNFLEIWEKHIKEDLGKSRLKKEDLKLLASLGEQIGYLDVQMQLNNIDLYVEQLEVEIRQAKAEAAKKVRIYQCLGTMAGILFVIFMI